MEGYDVGEIIRLVWPLIVLQLTLMVLAVVDIVRKKKTRNLSPVIWIIISVLGELVGPIVYFIFGRAED